jgi:hypothetical protein
VDRATGSPGSTRRSSPWPSAGGNGVDRSCMTRRHTRRAKSTGQKTCACAARRQAVVDDAGSVPPQVQCACGSTCGARRQSAGMAPECWVAHWRWQGGTWVRARIGAWRQGRAAVRQGWARGGSPGALQHLSTCTGAVETTNCTRTTHLHCSLHRCLERPVRASCRRSMRGARYSRPRTRSLEGRQLHRRGWMPSLGALQLGAGGWVAGGCGDGKCPAPRCVVRAPSRGCGDAACPGGGGGARGSGGSQPELEGNRIVLNATKQAPAPQASN